MKFYGQFTPSVDKFIYERYFPEIGIEGVFVECGAFDGLTECSCKFFEETMGWQGYNFEPIPWVFEKLKENRPNSINVNFGMSDKERSAIFHAVDHPHFGLNCTNGSLEHSTSHKAILDEIGCKIKDIEVQLITWPSFIKKYNIESVDLFVLDVEGHELSVIEGMKGSSVLPDIICIEYGHIGLNKVRNSLEPLGYCYDVTSNANAYFVKKEKLSLFSLRKVSSLVVGEENFEGNELIKQNNIILQDRVEELESLYNDITNSKSWKILENIKKLIGRK